VAKQPVLRIAMRDFQVADVDPHTAKLVQNAVLQELRKLQGVSVVSFEEVRMLMEAEAERASVGCDDDGCMAEIASALGADVMLVGGLAKVSGDHFFSMKRISQADARVEGQVSKRLTAQDGEEFLAAVGPIVEELFAERPLRSGQTRGVAPEVALRLNPPPLQPWVFWSLTGVASAATLTSLAAFGTFGLSAAQLNEHMDTAKTKTVSFQRAEQLAAQGNAALATGVIVGLVGVGAGVAAGVSALFVDWQGYAEQQE